MHVDAGTRRQPNPFQRWVAEHPWQWTLLLIGVGVVIVADSLTRFHDVPSFLFDLALVAGFALAGAVGATLARLRVRRYDTGARGA